MRGISRLEAPGSELLGKDAGVLAGLPANGVLLSAVLWTLSANADGKTIADAIWTYENPFPAMSEISGHLAFYPDKVKIEEVT